ncbi:SUKH-3 domain-containing protein [Actinoplanes sp. RD1]|uniref:SUKH-3 domain-containing protein n=1 Tax=Actinoplanes sp. RD1 TaxID=3064538 RepID=UPI0027411F64|nr:SUKH-3 domain-containing protein [Actinoplanes sp. RD1]
MITRAEAEEIAAGWARRETERRGYECTPMVSEFDLGFVVWTSQPRTVRPMPGDHARTVIDRETGVLSTFPGVPPAVVAAMYRERRPIVAAQRRTVDPQVELRRNARRLASPTTAAHLTVDGRLFTARGAKGDQTIDHHPLVARRLAELGAPATVRGADRHAELIVLSDALHEADRLRSETGGDALHGDDGLRSEAGAEGLHESGAEGLHESDGHGLQEGDGDELREDAARAWLRTANFGAFLIREPGDPLAGAEARPCESCITVLVDFALLPWSCLAWTEPFRPWSANIAQPGRFPEPVAGVLADGGWRPVPAAVAEALADGMIDDALTVPGTRHRLRAFPAARAALTDFPGIFCGVRGPGVRRQVRWLNLEPAAAAHTADVLGEFGEVLGVALFPLGVEAKGDAIIAIDERGRVFALDQGGEWFVGETLDEALINLLTGDGPAERVRDDGTW